MIRNLRWAFAFLCGVGLVSVLCGAQPGAPSREKSPGVDSRRQQLLSLFDEQWEYEMRVHPEFATALGDNRYNDRLDNESAEAVQSELEQARKFLARFHAGSFGVGISRKLSIMFG